MEVIKQRASQTATNRVDTSHAIHILIPYTIPLVSLLKGDILVLTLHLGGTVITTIGEVVEVSLGATTPI